MRLLNINDLPNDRYYSGRVEYIKKVIEIIKPYNFKTSIEMGAYKTPINLEGDIIDIKEYCNNTIIHDCMITPRPIEDKKYDLFIGLQCLEHLGFKQKKAWAEICRISNNAIISLPYKRHCPNDCHHMIDEEVVGEWTNEAKRTQKEIIGGRIIYFFENIKGN